VFYGHANKSLALSDFWQEATFNISEGLRTPVSWIKRRLSTGHRDISGFLVVILLSFPSLDSTDLSITVMGESAGGGSIMHHITSRGGTTVPVFKRAIPQSAAFNPQFNPTRMD
jgi:hypothetical protein